MHLEKNDKQDDSVLAIDFFLMKLDPNGTLSKIKCLAFRSNYVLDSLKRYDVNLVVVWRRLQV